MIRIVETDGDVVELLATTAEGDVVAIAEMTRAGDDLIMKGLHLDGPGVGALGPGGLRKLAAALGEQQGAKRVVVYGGVRTTEANPGHTPRPIIIPAGD